MIRSHDTCHERDSIKTSVVAIEAKRLLVTVLFALEGAPGWFAKLWRETGDDGCRC